MSNKPDIAEFGELVDAYQCAQKDGSISDRAAARIALMVAYRAALSIAPAFNSAEEVDAEIVRLLDYKKHLWPEAACSLLEAFKAKADAPAAPTADASDERALFEAWALKVGYEPHTLQRKGSEYKFTTVSDLWDGWMARAALAAPIAPAADAPSDGELIADLIEQNRTLRARLDPSPEAHWTPEMVTAVREDAARLHAKLKPGHLVEDDAPSPKVLTWLDLYEDMIKAGLNDPAARGIAAKYAPSSTSPAPLPEATRKAMGATPMLGKVEAASPGITAEFKDWFEREWSSYQDKAISGGKIVSMAWALKGYRAAPPAASAQKGLSDAQKDALHAVVVKRGGYTRGLLDDMFYALLRESEGK